MNKVLIIDDVHPLLMEALTAAGFEPVYRPECSREEACALVADCVVLVLRSKLFIDEDFLKAAPRLRLIARAGAGTDNIHEEACAQSGVGLVHAGGANSDAVAEQTLGMLLSLMSNIAKGDREIRRGIWDREGNRGIELKGKTVGIIGFGYTGTAFAARLAGFGVQVLAYDPYKKASGFPFVKQVEMEVIFREADVLSLHVPLTDETRNLVDAAYMNNFKKPLILLNLSRGQVVCTADVVKALQSGVLRGFAADVLETEPLSALTSEDKKWFEPLKGMDQVLLTPHVGGWSNESYERISGVLAARIIRWFNRESQMLPKLLEYYKI
ncbi:MAG: phosphoglycerate dehydrogenase [Bacteroidetes bacterium]|nr:phosphoglycerate dehydrogenase [Bacteroidota bacterium]